MVLCGCYYEAWYVVFGNPYFDALIVICGFHATMQTVNDVLFGVVSSGLSRYLDRRGPNGKHHLCHISVVLVNFHGTQWWKIIITIFNLVVTVSSARWASNDGGSHG